MTENNFESNFKNDINNILLSSKDISSICSTHLAQLSKDRDSPPIAFSESISKELLSEHYLFTARLVDLVQRTDEYLSSISKIIDMPYFEAYDEYFKKYTEIFEAYMIFRENIDLFLKENEKLLRAKEIPKSKIEKILSELIYRSNIFSSFVNEHL